MWLLTGKRRGPIDRRRVRGAHLGLKRVLVADMLVRGEPPYGWKEFSDAMLRQAIGDAVQMLPERDAQALKLAYFGGCSNRDIAHEFGMTEAAVASRLRRALDFISDRIQHSTTVVVRRAMYAVMTWVGWRSWEDWLHHAAEVAAVAAVAMVVVSNGPPPARAATPPAPPHRAFAAALDDPDSFPVIAPRPTVTEAAPVTSPSTVSTPLAAPSVPLSVSAVSVSTVKSALPNLTLPAVPALPVRLPAPKP